MPFYFANLRVSGVYTLILISSDRRFNTVLTEQGTFSDAVGKIKITVDWDNLYSAKEERKGYYEAREGTNLMDESPHEKSKKLATHRVLLGA